MLFFGPITASFLFIFVLLILQFKWQIWTKFERDKSRKASMLCLGLEPWVAGWLMLTFHWAMAATSGFINVWAAHSVYARSMHDGRLLSWFLGVERGHRGLKFRGQLYKWQVFPGVNYSGMKSATSKVVIQLAFVTPSSDKRPFSFLSLDLNVCLTISVCDSVTRFGNLLNFGQLFNVFGYN